MTIEKCAEPAVDYFKQCLTAWSYGLTINQN